VPVEPNCGRARLAAGFMQRELAGLRKIE